MAKKNTAQIIKIFKETGILSMQVEFSRKFYMPDGKAPLNII